MSAHDIEGLIYEEKFDELCKILTKINITILPINLLHVIVKNTDYDDRHYQLMRLLISRGYNINHQDIEGKTVLMYALDFRDEELIDFLLSKGAGVNFIDNEGYSCLGYAIWSHQINLVKKIIERGAEINIKSKKKVVQPLTVAVAECWPPFDEDDTNRNILKFLIEIGGIVDEDAVNLTDRDDLCEIIFSTIES
jgi:ankyrin repeat protein